MSLTEAYAFLFADSFMTALVLPIQMHLVFPVMIIFGDYNLYLILAITTLGTFIASLANWYMGYFILLASKYEPKGDRAVGFTGFCRRNAAWLLLFSWIPVFGSIITVITGVVKVRLKLVAMIVPAVNFVYYCVMSQLL